MGAKCLISMGNYQHLMGFVTDSGDYWNTALINYFRIKSKGIYGISLYITFSCFKSTDYDWELLTPSWQNVDQGLVYNEISLSSVDWRTTPPANWWSQCMSNVEEGIQNTRQTCGILHRYSESLTLSLTKSLRSLLVKGAGKPKCLLQNLPDHQNHPR